MTFIVFVRWIVPPIAECKAIVRRADTKPRTTAFANSRGEITSDSIEFSLRRWINSVDVISIFEYIEIYSDRDVASYCNLNDFVVVHVRANYRSAVIEVSCVDY